MGGKIISALGGGEGGSFADILLPLSLGVAASAHPALARGAHAITTSMAAAGRNRRLRDVVALEQKKEGRAEKTFEHQQKMWPSQEAKAGMMGPYPSGGGEYQYFTLDQSGQPVPHTLIPRYAGGPKDMAIREGYGKQANRLYEERVRATQPILEQARRDAALFQHNLTTQRQQEITPSTAIARINSIQRLMQTQYNSYLSSNVMPSEAEKEMFVRQMHSLYGPELEFLERKAGADYPKAPRYDSPPPGYVPTQVTDPQTGATIWRNQNDPNARYWYPAVPWRGF